jgi:hypothetical protein
MIGPHISRNRQWTLVRTLFDKILLAQLPDSVWLDLLLAFIVGPLYALALLGPAVMNPRNISWVHGDPATYYIGWALFRQDPHLHWPLAYTNRIGYPLGDSVALMDVNPLLAVILKGLSPLLPDPFQYLGIASALSCSLQMFFALRLFRVCLGRHAIAVLLSSIFFLLSPPLTLRFVGHYALTNQWLLTAALLIFVVAYLNCFTSRTKLVIAILALGAVSVSINPYLAFQVLSVLIAAVITLKLHRLTWTSALSVLAALIVVSGAAAYAFGFIIPGGQGYGGFGYRLYSLNLLSPFDPNSFGAVFVRQWPLFVREQSEGYCYLGLGVLLLGIAALLTMVWDFAKIPRLPWRSLAPLVLCCLALTLLALSTRITLGPKVIVDLDPTERLTPFLAVLRSSGRLFWVPYYALVAGILILSFNIFGRRWGSVVIGVALTVQVIDTVPLRQNVHLSLTRSAVPQPLQSPTWAKLGKRYDTLIVMPPFQCAPTASPGGEDGADIFGMLAAEQRMRTNSYRAGRLTGVSAAFHCKDSLLALMRRPLPLAANAVYVVSPEIATTIAANGGRCHEIDGFAVCSSNDDFGLGPSSWESPTQFWLRTRFRLLLLRDPTDQELTNLTQVLDSRRQTPADVLLQLYTSDEFERHSLPMMWSFLDQQGRWPTFAEWRAGIQSGQTLTHPESDRDRALVELLYFGILERDPDQMGVTGWTSVIQRRTSLKEIINGFLSSSEYKLHGYER